MSRCVPRLIATLLLAVGVGPIAAEGLPSPPPVEREFRAAWIATVANIDWPTRRDLSAEAMRDELAGLLDLAAELRMNAVVLQVRPACDAVYASELEPWSEFLTGQQGKAPGGGFDPLAWACDEAHRRGLELHAWFNPYRAWHPSAVGEPDAAHVSNRLPSATKSYGVYQWLDPGDADAVAHSIAVIRDVVRRYDVDGVHFDDYFYPYPVTTTADDGATRETPFPDDASWQAYLDATPEADRMERDDWRRDNVNQFIRRVGEVVHEEKPHVKYGVSPFGIWRPGVPPSIKGFDPYAKLYADARLWFREGWVDYLTPQLYWPIDQAPQSFTTLLGWWAEENRHGRHLWPGLYTSKTGFDEPMPAQEIIDEIEATRAQRGAEGHVHFSIKALRDNDGGVADRLRETYAEPALIPATPWRAGDRPPPGAPTIRGVADRAGSFAFEPARGERPRLWVVQKRCGDTWTTAIVEGGMRGVTVRPDEAGVAADALAVSAVDRFGRQGPPAVVAVGSAGREE